MVKRSREEDKEIDRSAKRLRPNRADRVSLLSDELLLRILCYLPVSDLVLCQRLSRRLKSLAGDSQLWKALFYERFVRPRASRIPGLRDQETSARSLYYSSKVSKWLDDDHLVRRGKATNWKRQYKLRHRWSRGSASVSETQVAEQPSTSQLLVRLYEDIVVVADALTGLRAWSFTGEDRLIASASLGPAKPTSLAIDGSGSSEDGVNVSIGSDDGSFVIYTLRRKGRRFAERYTHTPSTNGAVHAIAYASPYLLTMTEEPLLSLYRFDQGSTGAADSTLLAPNLLSSLRSHTAYPPISLAIRTSSSSIVASIAYAMPTWTLGWSVGLQELRLKEDGTIVESRMSSASTKGLITRLAQSGSSSPAAGSRTISPAGHGFDDVQLSSISKPTSLSYNHPYLLSAHADNTLTLYMVTSDAEELSIGAGNRLWGHTSSVSGAHVGDRGKAVSVSASGNELRVWELEGGLSSGNSRRRAAAGEVSVQVRPERNSTIGRSELDEALVVGVAGAIQSTSAAEPEFEESKIAKGWVAFDEEKVVIIREKMRGAQALVVYDFS